MSDKERIKELEQKLILALDLGERWKNKSRAVAEELEAQLAVANELRVLAEGAARDLYDKLTAAVKERDRLREFVSEFIASWDCGCAFVSDGKPCMHCRARALLDELEGL